MSCVIMSRCSRYQRVKVCSPSLNRGICINKVDKFIFERELCQVSCVTDKFVKLHIYMTIKLSSNRLNKMRILNSQMLLTFHISNTIFMFEDKNSLLALTGAQERAFGLFVSRLSYLKLTINRLSKTISLP